MKTTKEKTATKKTDSAKKKISPDKTESDANAATHQTPEPPQIMHPLSPEEREKKSSS